MSGKVAGMTGQFQLLGQPIDLFKLEDVTDGEHAAAKARIGEFAYVVDHARAELSAEQQDIFRLINGVRIFKDVAFKGRRMSRSFMDIGNRQFYWHADDILSAGYSTGNRVATYYFHDAFHVVQWLNGDRGVTEDELVNREVSATQAQLALAEVLNADQQFKDFLLAYSRDRRAILDRLKSGAGSISIFFGLRPRYQDHLPIF